MHRDLETAFRATRYHVMDAAGSFVLQVDHPSQALQHLLRAVGQQQAALLTAYNPGARQQDAVANAAAQQALLADLDAAGFRAIPGRNEDPEGRWPDEASVLVPGLSLFRARQLASRYRQAAFLWSDDSATPRLVETAAD